MREREWVEKKGGENRAETSACVQQLKLAQIHPNSGTPTFLKRLLGVLAIDVVLQLHLGLVGEEGRLQVQQWRKSSFASYANTTVMFAASQLAAKPGVRPAPATYPADGAQELLRIAA